MNDRITSDQDTEPQRRINYWCTWGAQNFARSNRGTGTDEMIGSGGFTKAMKNLSQEAIFGDSGWSTRIPARARGDLLIVLDVGWDLPPNAEFPADLDIFGSCDPDPDRFPCVRNHETPEARLGALKEFAVSHGWAGLGLWISPQVPGASDASADPELGAAYWRTRAEWCAAAGINYWKVDIGAGSYSSEFREAMTAAARTAHPQLVVEHARNCGPLNDYTVTEENTVAGETGAFASWDNVLQESLELLAVSDVFRDYDVLPQHSVPTSIDRAVEILEGAEPSPARAILNVEDELYLGAALGCAVGIMRHPDFQEADGADYDPTRTRQRTVEMLRALAWQRLAPPVPVGVLPIVRGEERMSDTWTYEPGDAWPEKLVGRSVIQSAPAVVARGIPLPSVSAPGAQPYVVASRFPNGHVAVATLPRVVESRRIEFQPALVSLADCEDCTTIAIFGSKLSVSLPVDLGPRRVIAWDLAGGTRVDVTDQVEIEPGSIHIPAELVAGLCMELTTDLSAPAIALEIIDSTHPDTIETGVRSHHV